ncbi:rhomboid family intramembrane serine protease [Microbacterium sp. A93]|uniref:rhomboid family intramembrane serine protease n=1 Tax=Microbacterium sp. A93 TaxID=3450716 RepID=UPI003F4261E8
MSHQTSGGPDGGAGRQLPVCPRHPDRPSFIRCQRCGHPACPECQRPAAVGIHCVDCAAGRGPAEPGGTSRSAAQDGMPDDGRAGFRPGVTPAGGPQTGWSRPAPPQRRPHAGRASLGGQPWVTWTMIGLCVVMYALQWITSGQRVGITEQFFYAGVFTSAVEVEPWRMLTSAFLHSLGNPLHIVLNLYTLWLMGRILEPVLGWPRFLALYLISAFGGSVAVLLLSNPYIPVVGASGAVYGLFAALFIVMRKTGGKVTGIAALIGVNLVISFVPGANISWQGHVGGLITGAAVAAVLAYLPRRPHGPGWSVRVTGRAATVQWVALAAILVVLVVLALIGMGRLSEPALIQYSLTR